jgi:hypothetical protein
LALELWTGFQAVLDELSSSTDGGHGGDDGGDSGGDEGGDGDANTSVAEYTPALVSFLELLTRLGINDDSSLSLPGLLQNVADAATLDVCVGIVWLNAWLNALAPTKGF